MIPRYARPEMVDIWSEENKYQIWLDIEIYACEALERLGVIPSGVAAEIRNKGRFSVERILEIEREVKHDVIAFLSNVAESVGDSSRFVHQGMTSSDVLDTCLAVQLKRSAEILQKTLQDLLDALKNKALEHQYTPCIGRSHGIHGEPTTFGLKLLGHYAAFARHKEHLSYAQNVVATCAISGAMGTFANVNPEVEAHVAERLGLRVEPISTQIIPRDRHALYFSVLGGIAASLENLAVEVRHLQRTEVREAMEFFSEKQKGSSAMPHKRNPILSENITGLSRLIRSYVTPALENVVQWHERDIAHSSVERNIAPDATITLHFALHRMTGLIRDLIVDQEQMQKNLDLTGGIYNSQRILLLLTQKGVSREDAYRIVQTQALRSWQEGKPLADLLKVDPLAKSYLSDAEIDACMDLTYHFRYVAQTFQRVLGM